MIVVIERDHVLDLAATPVLLPEKMALAKELPIRDVGGKCLRDIKIEFALDDA